MHAKMMLVSLGLLLSMPIFAQQMYRCGSTYQDRPCDGAQPGKKLGGSGNSSAAEASSSPKPAVDLNCTRRGSDAEKIKWTREAGRTEEMQLAAARDSGQRALISEVYGRSGTSGEVRAAVEAECMAEKDRAAQAAVLMEAAAKLQGNKTRSDANGTTDPAKK